MDILTILVSLISHSFLHLPVIVCKFQEENNRSDKSSSFIYSAYRTVLNERCEIY